MEDTTIQTLASALNFRQLRQDVISANVANAETPGYKSKVLEFEEALARAIDIDGLESMKADDKRHFKMGSGGFAMLEPSIYEDPNGISSPDGNTVDRDQEMAKMAENKILYDASVQLLNKKLAMLRQVLSDQR